MPKITESEIEHLAIELLELNLDNYILRFSERDLVCIKELIIF